jgi:hypothetical protein
MTQDYYIHSGSSRQGPYDLVMIVRKIRNGQLPGTTPVQLGDGEIQPAQKLPELAEFFSEKKDEWADTSKHGQLHNHGLSAMLGTGLRFLQHNQMSTIFSAVLLLGVIMVTGLFYLILPDSLHVIAYVIGFWVSLVMLSCFQLSILRMTRGQSNDIFYFSNKILPKLPSLMVASFFISLPANIGLVLLTVSDSQILSIIGLVVFAIPGLFTITLYAFAPLLILDQDYSAWSAMSISRKAVFKSGIENIGVLFALFVINFTASLFALLPVMISLPITMSALTDIYDNFFG